MIKLLLEQIRRLPTVVNYYAGLKVGEAPMLPDNIIVFCRSGIRYDKGPCIHHRFLLSINLGAPCDMIIEGVRYSLATGQAALVHPWQHHLFLHNREDIVRLMITFETEKNTPLLPAPNRIFTIGDNEYSLLLQLIECYLEGHDAISCSLLSALLLRRIQNKQTSHSNAMQKAKYPKLIDEIIAFIQSHLNSPLSIAQLARRFNLSPSHFRLRFRQALGISVGKYLIDARLNRAMGYLGECNMNIEEIAGQCGYNSVYAFSHIFKKHIGVSALQYRKQCKQSNTQE